VRNGRRILLTSITSSIRSRKVLLHAVNLRHGTDSFTSPPKEVALHRPRLGSNPRTLGLVASTLTTSPPRATLYSLGLCNSCRRFCVRILHLKEPSVNISLSVFSVRCPVAFT
jgi:hypothetical protein